MAPAPEKANNVRMSDHDENQRLLEQLRDELAQIKHGSVGGSERLDRLLDRIDSHLDEEEEDSQIAEELREEAVEFELEHPDAAASIRTFLNMLSNLGI